MSDVDVKWDSNISPAMLAQFVDLTDKEATKLLYTVGERLLKEKKLLKRHWTQMESRWPENAPSTVAGKARMGVSPRPWVNEGEAHDAVQSGDPGGVITLRAGKKRILGISIRKMNKGVNVYDVTQKGRFRGIRDESGKEHSASEVHELNQRDQAAYALARGGGYKGRYYQWRSEMKGSLASTLKGNRMSDRARPLVPALAGDMELAQPLVHDEFYITLRYRGLVD